MTRRLAIAIATVALGVGCAGGDADTASIGEASPATMGTGTAEANAAAPRLREYTVPDGTLLRVGLASKLSSEDSKVEDRVRGVLREAVLINGVRVLPEGALLEGLVLQAERSGRVKGLAQLAFHFTGIAAHGETHRISTARIVYTAEPTKKDDATKVGIGAGAGAVAGAIAGGSKGAAIGSGAGAAAGTGVVLATRGDEVMLSPGTVVTARLTAPLSVLIPLD